MNIRNMLSQNQAVRWFYMRLKRTQMALRRIQYRNLVSAPQGNTILASHILQGAPLAAGKMGSLELEGLRVYRRDPSLKTLSPDLRQKLFANVGVFPTTNEVLQTFFESYTAALREMDVLGVWFNPGEYEVASQLAPQAQQLEVRALEPYYHAAPWSRALAGKKVLLISPFTRSCAAQYARRAKVWPGRPDILPEMDLKVLRAPLSAALVKPLFADWPATLADLKAQIDAMDFEVALVGVGGFSLPLVAHCKKMGKQAIHMGGATQILFGVAGARWDKGTAVYGFINEAWVAPSGDERPENINTVERGCYW